ncbi:MAG: hypothetical protein MZU95_06075, partial [Desulfomicrobium escambiense]|nr:hypothetical protein [Desulfomicrobium escambiense]
LYFVQLRIAKVKQTTTNGIDSTCHRWDHTKPQGLGYQICDDNIRDMIKASGKYGISSGQAVVLCAIESVKAGDIFPPWQGRQIMPLQTGR